MSKASFPTPDEIVAREAGQRRIAAYAALASALLVVIAMILEYKLGHADVPDFDATDLAQTLAITKDGGEMPRSFLTAVGQFQLDHSFENVLIALLRGISILLLLPMVLLLVRAVRSRGGQLGGWVAPVVTAGLALMGILNFAVFGILQLAIYRSARDAGFAPGDIWDAVRDSPSTDVQYVMLLASLITAVAFGMATLQSARIGLLPRVVGWLGLVVAFLFVLPLDQPNIFRAIYFSILAFVVSGRAYGGTLPAWDQGVAVLQEPRMPAAPREPKGRRGKKADAAE
ncbi:MAG: hypothetical protein PGN13_00165 [Patulibacter minatonensis]